MNTETASTSTRLEPIVSRPLLRDWVRENWPDPEQWRFANAAQKQITWVRNHLAFMAWNSLLKPCEAKYWPIEKREATLTVDGTHTSKSVTLPVYRLDIAGVTIKVRGNFHDWCVRCWSPMKRPFPEWMRVDMDGGFFEGMESDDSPVSFCVRDEERLFATLWWMFNEAI